MTNYNLRPLAQRLANGVAKTKGYNGAGLSPWRTAKKVTRPGAKEKGTLTVVDGKTVWTREPSQEPQKRLAVKVLKTVTKKDGKETTTYSYPDMGGSKKAKGLPAVSKEVDNSGKCAGGADFWYEPGDKGLAEPEANCPGGDYRPNLVYRKETKEWVELTNTTNPTEWVTCDGHRVAKPVATKPHKARVELTSLSQGRYSYEEVEPTNYTKNRNYQHGPLHNVPHPDHSCMAWGGWKGQAQAQTYKQGQKLQIAQPLSLEGLAEMAMAEAWETEGAELDTADLLGTYGQHEAYENDAPWEITNHEAVLEWAKQSTKPVSWEACLLWAHGKTLAEVGTVQGVSKATAQSRVERTLARLQSKVHTLH